MRAPKRPKEPSFGCAVFVLVVFVVAIVIVAWILVSELTGPPD